MFQKESDNETSYQQFKCAKPLDFSYRKIQSLEELNGNDKPLKLRVRGTPVKSRQSNRYKTSSFWLNNNNLKNVNGLRSLTDRLFESANYLSWLDLSGNNLTTISEEFLLFPNLSMLYLHRNNISDLTEVYKLRKLTKLRALKLNDNPMAMSAGYRGNVVRFLPGLRKLDNVVVLRSERETFGVPLTKELQARMSATYPDAEKPAKTQCRRETDEETAARR